MLRAPPRESVYRADHIELSKQDRSGFLLLSQSSPKITQENYFNLF